MSFKSNDIIFLLGAGCSNDAGIPIANEMIKDIENNLINREWGEFKDLYNYVKSSILYAEGIFGSFNNSFNIEKFVNALSELEKRERNIVYPFIANWNNRLLDLAGKDFININKFKNLITNQLIGWVKRENYQQEARYYQKFYDFQKELQLSLRIFSLNYDLCFELLKPNDFTLELGFDENRIWNSFRFEENPNVSIGVYLYKLHGSITWKREKEKGNILKLSEHPEKEPDLIFGTDTKLQSIDPYLFYVYEFRKYSLECKIIIVIGYSFSDGYINSLIKQAIENDPNRKIICIAPKSEDNKKEITKRKLQLKDDNQIIIIEKKAKEFLENELTVKKIAEFLDVKEDVF